jgi:hypothetical protein
MASNLSSIGFQFRNDAEFEQAMTRLAAAAQDRVACDAGDYLVWRCRSGASIWLHLGLPAHATRTIEGLTPFFDGKSDVPIRITSRRKRAGDNAFEGALYGWIAPEAGAGDGSEGAYPALLEAIDFAALADLRLPVSGRAQICGFARELLAFASAEAHATRRDGDMAIAPQAFIPIGLLPAVSDDAPQSREPSPTAFVTGRVAEHRLLTNSATGRQYHWLLVESYAAAYDVLADPEIVAGNIVVGGTVEATCAMFSRMIG